MAVTVYKTWTDGETLTHSDLNSSFSQIVDNGEDLGWPATKAKDLNGYELIFDADADTSITSDTDDQLDFRVGGTDRFTLTSTTATFAGVNFSLGNQQVHAVTAGSAATDLLNIGQLQAGGLIYAADAEASDTYVITLSPAITAYTTGMSANVKFNTANTGACTINMNGVGAKSIKLTNGNDPADGDIPAGGVGNLLYDGTNMVLLSTPAVTALSENLVQMVYTQDGAMATGTTLVPFDDTIPQNNEGDEYITQAITPTASANLLEINLVAEVASSVDNHMIAALFQDSTANALAVSSKNMGGSANRNQVMNFTYVMTADTVAATTFKLRIGGTTTGTTTFNGNAGAAKMGGTYASSIVIKEITV